jgi:hypothetical protein
MPIEWTTKVNMERWPARIHDFGIRAARSSREDGYSNRIGNSEAGLDEAIPLPEKAASLILVSLEGNYHFKPCQSNYHPLSYFPSSKYVPGIVSFFVSKIHDLHALV